MRGLHNTISRLNAMRQIRVPVAPAADHLTEIEDFGSNPGQLHGWAYVPQDLPRGAPLVVVLHGCTQTASGYDRGSGWSAAADQHGFAVLFPEQQRGNNPNLCFNWFSPNDAGRDKGEALSIRQMVAAVQAQHGTDPGRVFVTGLSAGGAMAVVMLATYPDVFAGGAVIAGLPYGTAQSVPEAFDRMRGHGDFPAEKLARLVLQASKHVGPWPTLSVWHGTADATVVPSNAEAIVDQWRTLHGASKAPVRSDRIDGYPHRVWTDKQGRDVIEEYVITGMAHGTPLSAAASGDGETAGPYMLEAGISSTQHTLRFWGISTDAGEGARQPRPKRIGEARQPELPMAELRPAAVSVSNVQKTIEDALRSAGLLRY